MCPTMSGLAQTMKDEFFLFFSFYNNRQLTTDPFKENTLTWTKKLSGHTHTHTHTHTHKHTHTHTHKHTHTQTHTHTNTLTQLFLIKNKIAIHCDTVITICFKSFHYKSCKVYKIVRQKKHSAYIKK